MMKNNIVSKQQLSNLKAHLYKQILISPRLNQSKNIRLKIKPNYFATNYIKKVFTNKV